MLEMMDVPRTVLCFLFSVLCVEHCSSGIATAKTFRGAVYEHVVIYPTNYYQYVNRSDALKNMMANLNIYKEQAEKASEQNSDIIIFPEDGIYGTGFSRNRIKPYLEFIPDPNQVQWNPCSDPDRYPFTEVQHFLSSLAKNNSIYLVANMGDKQPCSSQCTPDGQFQYNTDVVYDNHGEFIGRYHKQHLFHELQFATPNTTDFTYFDTEFGRVGVFTCFYNVS